MEKEGVKKIVKKIAETYHLPYFTITPTFSICPIHGYISGEHEYCPKCDQEIGYVPEKEGEKPKLVAQESRQDVDVSRQEKDLNKKEVLVRYGEKEDKV